VSARQAETHRYATKSTEGRAKEEFGDGYAGALHPMAAAIADQQERLDQTRATAGSVVQPGQNDVLAKAEANGDWHTTMAMKGPTSRRHVPTLDTERSLACCRFSACGIPGPMSVWSVCDRIPVMKKGIRYARIVLLVLGASLVLLGIFVLPWFTLTGEYVSVDGATYFRIKDHRSVATLGMGLWYVLTIYMAPIRRPPKYFGFSVLIFAVVGGWLYIHEAAAWLDIGTTSRGSFVDVASGAILAIFGSFILLIAAPLAIAASFGEEELPPTAPPAEGMELSG